MTRWTSAAPRRPFLRRALRALGTAALAGTAAFAHAQPRPFPPNALRGRLRIDAPPAVTLDGRPDQLSPGARIRDIHNRFVTTASFAGQDLVVNYTREHGGQINEVWVLSAEEAAVRRPSAQQPGLLDRLFGS